MKTLKFHLKSEGHIHFQKKTEYATLLQGSAGEDTDSYIFQNNSYKSQIVQYYLCDNFYWLVE